MPVDRAVDTAPEQLRALVAALQALRGVAQETAVTLATEFGKRTPNSPCGPPQGVSWAALVASAHGGTGRESSADGITGRCTRPRTIPLRSPKPGHGFRTPRDHHAVSTRWHS